MYMINTNIYFHRLFRGVAAAIALVTIVSVDLSGQTSTGTIRGTVTGAGGAPVGNAQIQARNIESGIQRGGLSRDDGFYVLAGLVPGTYDVTIRRIGSEPQSRRVVVQIGATQIQDFALAEQAI